MSIKETPPTASVDRPAWCRAAIGSFLVHAAFAAIGIAGSSKFVDLWQFRQDLETWSLVPRAMIPLLVVITPVTEVVACVWWFAGTRRDLSASLGVGLYSTFLVAIAAQIALGKPPTCGCFGLLVRFEQSHEQAIAALIRTGLLAAGLVVGIWLRSATPSHTRLARRSARHAPVGRCRGFTLVEMVVSIVLVALVIVLVLPSLGDARRLADGARSSANLRSHARVLHIYAHESEDVLPFLCDPEATATVFRHAGVTVTTSHFGVDSVWNYPFAPSYYDDRHDHETFHVPWRPFSGWSDYILSDTMFARPEYWNPSTRVAGTSQWRPTRLAEVAFPSAKGAVLERPESQVALMSTNQGRRLGGRTPIRFALFDGAVTTRRGSELNTPMPTGVGQGIISTFGASYILHTIDGVRGRDVR